MIKIILLLATLAASVNAQYCPLVGSYLYAQDRASTFLGDVSFDKYDTASIMNSYGNYGSKYSSTSIFNSYGDYGSAYSDFSPMNKYATNPPLIIEVDASRKTYLLAVVSLNRYVSMPIGFTGSVPVIDPNELIGFLKFGNCTTTGIATARKKRTQSLTKKPVFDLLGRHSLYHSP